MSEYSELLTRPQWRKLAAKVRKRDGYKCVQCGDNKCIHVHHTVYVSGRKPWEYDESYLITLCSVCHNKEHETGKSFTTFDKNIIQDSMVKKVKRKKNKKNKKVSGIQQRWDNLKADGKIPDKLPFQVNLEKSEKEHLKKRK